METINLLQQTLPFIQDHRDNEVIVSVIDMLNRKDYVPPLYFAIAVAAARRVLLLPVVDEVMEQARRQLFVDAMPVFNKLIPDDSGLLAVQGG